MTLTSKSMKDGLGIDSLGHRIKLLQAVAKLATGANIPHSPIAAIIIAPGFMICMPANRLIAPGPP